MSFSLVEYMIHEGVDVLSFCFFFCLFIYSFFYLHFGLTGDVNL